MKIFVSLFCLLFLFSVEAYCGQQLDELIAQAEKGSSEAQVKLGHAYFEGKGISRDYKKAIFWYQKAADQGDAKGQRALGARYEFGYGVEKDSVKAAYWYKKAADQGLARAQTNLGILY
ncbi:MAG: sel1 repeat family protein, partial [Desulfobulbaceae bacterium]|nr:sel1 repeat family protein [Desulfobulbaceae bacterium]